MKILRIKQKTERYSGFLCVNHNKLYLEHAQMFYRQGHSCDMRTQECKVNNPVILSGVQCRLQKLFTENFSRRLTHSRHEITYYTSGTAHTGKVNKGLFRYLPLLSCRSLSSGYQKRFLKLSSSCMFIHNLHSELVAASKFWQIVISRFRMDKIV